MLSLCRHRPFKRLRQKRSSKSLSNCWPFSLKKPNTQNDLLARFVGTIIHIFSACFKRMKTIGYHGVVFGIIIISLCGEKGGFENSHNSYCCGCFSWVFCLFPSRYNLVVNIALEIVCLDCLRKLALI